MKFHNPKIFNLNFVFINILSLFISLAVLLVLLKPYFFSKITPFSSLGFYSLVEESKENYSTEDLIKGRVIKGELNASENNLGILLVRFDTFNRINSDLVAFRFKEKREKRWYFENSYKVDQFQTNQYFTFGFPKIKKSKGKTYIFEIESLKGRPNDSVSISPKEPQMAVVYQVEKNDLKNIHSLSNFFYKKILYAISYADIKNIIISIIVYLILFCLLSLIVDKKNYLSKYENLLMDLLSLGLYLLFVVFSGAILFLLSLIKKYEKHKKNILPFINKAVSLNKKYSVCLYFLFIIFIFYLALFMRFSFYFDPENFGKLIYSGIGGHGDYDYLLRFSEEFLSRKDSAMYFYSLMDDYPFLIRFISLFFNFFGFLKGVEYFSYFLIIVSSLISLLPLIILSRKNRISVGGFLGSLLLSVNPLSISLASGYAVDTFTSLLFVLFIIVYITYFEKQSYLVGFCLGLIAFINGLNRGMMIVSTFMSLALFAFYYFFKDSSFVRIFPFINLNVKSKLKRFIYGFIPIFSFLIFYFLWCFYYYHLFGIYWAASPQGILSLQNYISPSHIYSNAFVDSVVRYLGLSLLSLNNLKSLTLIPNQAYAFLLFIVIFFLFIKNKKRIFLIAVVVFLAGLLIIFPPLVITFSKLFKIADSRLIFPLKYFLNLKIDYYFYLFIFCLVIFLQPQLINKKFIKYFIVIFPYFMLIIFGYLRNFFDRHFIQMLLIFCLLFGSVIDEIIFSAQKYRTIYSKIVLFLVFVFSFYLLISPSITALFVQIEKINNYLDYYKNEQKYLASAEKTLPKDAIILVGSVGNQNLTLVSKITKRSVVYNVLTPDPILIPYGNKRFNTLLHASVDKRYIINLPEKADFIFADVIVNPALFNKYNFYLLDYGINIWNLILKDEHCLGYPCSFGNTYKLMRINVNENQRPVYKLVFNQEK